MRGLRFIWLFLVFFVTSCASPSVMRYSTEGAAKVRSAAPAEEYRIQPGDQLDIKFFYNPELNEQLVVRPDGRISLQLVNELMAAGMTPGQLTEKLRTSYSGQLKQPEVAVIVRTFNDQRVYVDGEVFRPGVVPLPGPMTVLQSISQAGGMKETARLDEVLVIRKNGQSKPVTIIVNLEDAIEGTDHGQDITLLPHDIVVVPRSKIANVNVWVDQYLRRNIPIPIGVGWGIN
ncbi:polysaccharide biosynthesis/export family protein [Geobacter sp. DSM 9736]|uniref:polysaccharide biosynthesis/export family protein n=1 Tax=Geobacter sp. DSM 9736 TaxID=1277350 RepID=UPI000B504485|nr:polysaccharide biosynthesis/export family protein [Geobacter sp. DSM 9736]SNB46147.1 protein involved in polysaccharide export, contains SLBB domain of the beta-grasp fold [Geobacter sp. DSM 9736]